MCNSDPTCSSEREQEILLDLINRARQHQEGSSEYRKLLNLIFFRIQNSCRLYRAEDILSGKSQAEYEEIYGEALQRVFVELNRKLIRDYDETRGRVMTRVNNLIRWRVLDIVDPPVRLPVAPPPPDGDDPFVNVPAGGSTPGEDVEVRMLYECLHQKIEENRSNLRSIYMRCHPDVNAYRVLRYILPLDFDPRTLREFAEESGIEFKPVQRFYRERCRPHVQQYVIECGWKPPAP